jgi:hypothetical protein
MRKWYHMCACVRSRGRGRMGKKRSEKSIGTLRARIYTRTLLKNRLEIEETVKN